MNVYVIKTMIVRLGV